MAHQRGVTTLSVLSGLGTDPYQPQPVAPPSVAARAGFVAACVLGAGALWWATRSVAPKRNRRRVSRNAKAKARDYPAMIKAHRSRGEGWKELLRFPNKKEAEQFVRETKETEAVYHRMGYAIPESKIAETGDKKAPWAYFVRHDPKKKNSLAGPGRKLLRNPKLVGNGKFNELDVFDSVATVRDAAPREQLGFMPPGLVKKLRSLPAGIYKYGHGPKRGEVLQRVGSSTALKGAITSARIGARAVKEHHWIIDNFDPKYPVVIRAIDDHGKTSFRVEEYAKQFERERVAVRRKSRSAR